MHRPGFIVPLIGLAASLTACASVDKRPPEALRGAETVDCANKAARLDHDFPTGALASCEVTSESSFRISIAPEDAPPINCSAWYAFRLDPRHRGPVTIELAYEACGHRYWPKTSADGVTWNNLPADAVTVRDEGKAARITVKLGKKPLFVAGQEVLPPTAYDEWLEGLSKHADAKRWLLGKSAEGRDIYGLTIKAAAGRQRETVLLVGRQHPPEVSGALAMLPFVETLLGDSDLARAYRVRFETVVVPMLNPDGVVRGHWRHNTGSLDLNRDWGPFTQPETRLMKGLMDGIAADPDRKLQLMIDFHSTQRDVFYTIPDEWPTEPPLFTRKWLDRLQERMPDYLVNRDQNHNVGYPVSKAYVYDTYKVPGITFEIGDETDRKLISRIGREAAIAMMEALLAEGREP